MRRARQGARIEYEGAICHVAFRRNERLDISRSDGDRRELIGRLRHTSKAYGVRICLASLMSRHVRAQVKTPPTSLAGDVEAVQVHDFVPGRYEVAYELLLRIVLRVDFGQGAQL